MKVIEPGHVYEVDSYDGGEPIRITFMKREGEGYPGNVGHHSGTNCQELMRVLIDRLEYLNKQIPCRQTEATAKFQRNSLWLMEDRAAERHGFADHEFDFRPEDIEEAPACGTCGHIMCLGHQQYEADPTTVVDRPGN